MNASDKTKKITM